MTGPAASARSVTLMTPHYHPETGAAARRCTALAEGLAALGWSPTVVTNLPHHPSMRVPAEYQVPTPDTRVERGVRVVRLRPDLVERDRLVQRLRAEASFAVRAARVAAGQPADVVVASSPYFFLGPAGAWVARRLGRPFVWDVRDLTWLYPAATGRRTFGADRVFDAWMQRVARRADGLVTTSEAQRAHFGGRQGVSRVIPNGVTREEWTRYGAVAEASPPSGVPRVVYVGLFGFMHGLATLLDVAEALPDVEVHLYGDGPERPALETDARRRGLANAYFHGHVGHAEVEQAYRSATVLVAPIRDRAAFRMIQPAKVWEYLATGRPVIHAGNGETAAILQREHLAWVVPPERPDAIVDAIREVLADPGEARAVAARARAWVGEHRDRGQAAVAWDELLRSVVDRD